MGYCGNCAKYIKKPFCEDICAKTGKIVPYFQQMPCFIDRATNPDEVEFSPAQKATDERRNGTIMKDPNAKPKTNKKHIASVLKYKTKKDA